jgi:hypothetical protein
MTLFFVNTEDTIQIPCARESVFDNFYEDFYAHQNANFSRFILLTALILVLEFFSLSDAKRKNILKVVQLFVLVGFLLIFGFNPSNIVATILIFAAYGIKNHLVNKDKSKTLARIWFGVAIFLILVQIVFATEFAIASSTRFIYTFPIMCNLDMKNIMFFIAPILLLAFFSFRRKNIALFLWAISLLLVTETFYFDEGPFFVNIIFISLFLPFMNMLLSDAR